MKRLAHRLLTKGMTAFALTALGLLAAAGVRAQGATAAAPAASPETEAAHWAAEAVEQPRAYGYTVGDIIEQRVLLEHDGAALELPELPRKERIAVWFTRRDAAVQTDAAGRRWLVLHYQIINAPKDVDTATLPAYRLAVRQRGQRAALSVNAWPLSVSPITPRYVDRDNAMPEMQADAPVPLPSRAVPQARAARALWVLGAIVLAWLGWWRWRVAQAGQRLPFARAMKQLRRLPAHEPQAWRCVHQALDATAGCVLQQGRLEPLFAAAPHLLALKPQVEAFYAASARRFFATAAGTTEFDLRGLCAALRRAERRAQ